MKEEKERERKIEEKKVERMKAFVYFSEGLTVSSSVIYYHNALSFDPFGCIYCDRKDSCREREAC